MAVVSGVITGDNVSATFTPTAVMSECRVGPISTGKIYLECSPDSGTTWDRIKSGSGVYIVLTPDPTVLYRFRSKAINTSVPYRMGP